MEECYTAQELVNEKTLGLIQWFVDKKVSPTHLYNLLLAGITKEDLIQITAMRLLEFDGRLPKTRSHTTYITQMTHFTSLMASRKRKGFKPSFNLEDHEYHLEDENENVPEADWEYVEREIYGRMERLTRRERVVIYRRFGLYGKRPRTLQQLADHFRMSKERIRQIQQQAIEKMKYGTV